MELLKQLLAAEKISISNLEKELKTLGYSGELSDEQAQEAFNKLKAKYSNKLAKPKNTIANAVNSPTIEAAVETASLQAKNIVNNSRIFAEKEAAKVGNQIVQNILAIPGMSIQFAIQQLANSGENLDFFRGEVEDFEAAFSSKFDIE